TNHACSTSIFSSGTSKTIQSFLPPRLAELTGCRGFRYNFSVTAREKRPKRSGIMWVSRHALKDPWQTQTALVAQHKLPRVCYEGNRASLDELRVIDERHTPAAIVNLAES